MLIKNPKTPACIKKQYKNKSCDMEYDILENRIYITKISVVKMKNISKKSNKLKKNK